MRYLFLILTLFCFSILKAQTVPQINNVPWYQFTNKLTTKGRLQIPSDTFSSATVLDTSSLANKNGTLYLYDTVGGVLGWHPATISPALLDSIRGTGVFSGSGVAINGGDNTKFDINVSGVIKDPLTGTAVYITKTATAQTVTNLASQNVTYISVNASGTIIQQSTPWTPEQRFTQLTGFVLVHSNRTNLNAVNNLFAVGYNGINQLHSFMDVFGMMNVSGNVFSGSVSNLSIDKTAGNVHRVGANETAVSQSPNRKSLGALTTATFRYRTQLGVEGADTTFIDPNKYDNSGSITAVPTNKWTVQHIAIFVSNLVRIQRGQVVYDTKEAAILGIQNNHFAYETNISENGLIRCYLVVQQGTTNFSDPNDFDFVEASKFGFSVGGGAGGVVDTSVIASKNYVQGNFWGIHGNGATYTQSLGTTSNFPVRFITNNAEVFALSTGQILTKTDASGTNQTGTDLHQGAGLGTGNAAGGAWRWYKSVAVASGTGQHTRTENGGMSSGGRFLLGSAVSGDDNTNMLQVTGGATVSSTGTYSILGSVNRSSTNIREVVLQLERYTTGAAAAGIGGSIQFGIENGSGSSVNAGSIAARLTAVTAGAESSDYLISGLRAGGAETFMQIQPDYVIIKNGADTLETKANARLNQTGVQTLTDGATITFDANSGTSAKVTLGGNRTLAFSNFSEGIYLTLVVIQDGTGSRTLTLPTCKVINGGAGAVTLTTAAGSQDILTFSKIGGVIYCNYGKNYN